MLEGQFSLKTLVRQVRVCELFVLCTRVHFIRGVRNFDICLRVCYTISLPDEQLLRNLQVPPVVISELVPNERTEKEHRDS